MCYIFVGLYSFVSHSVWRKSPACCIQLRPLTTDSCLPHKARPDQSITVRSHPSSITPARSSPPTTSTHTRTDTWDCEAQWTTAWLQSHNAPFRRERRHRQRLAAVHSLRSDGWSVLSTASSQRDASTQTLHTKLLRILNEQHVFHRRGTPPQTPPHTHTHTHTLSTLGMAQKQLVLS